MENNKILYSTDILIFSIDSRQNNNVRKLPKKYFSILLVKRETEPFKNSWCLPGGFVKESETSYEATKRILKKETNLSDFYVEQLGVFDDINRDPREKIISVAYMTLIDKNNIKGELAPNAKWFDIEIEEVDNRIYISLINNDTINIEISKKLINKESKQYHHELKKSKNIAFDHGLIINNGILALRHKANYSDIIFNLMPQVFTIGELKQVYEVILGKKLINSVFRRTMANKLVPVEDKIKTGGHRPSQKFSYKRN